MRIKCRSCNSENNVYIGDINEQNKFAGRTLYEVPQSSLYRCRHCNLFFKFPVLTQHLMEDLYKEGTINQWQYKPAHRQDWLITLNWLNSNLLCGKVLDIGCWDGAFLDYIGNKWDRNGVEINRLTAQKAKEKGIKILAQNIENLDLIDIQFDAVTAFDVIEHLHNPASFLKSMMKLTRIGGSIIISSGNTETTLWRVSKSKFSYCSIPEHISFINPDWCRYIAKSLNLKLEYMEKFSHASVIKTTRRLVELGKLFVYLSFPKLFSEARKIKHRITKRYDSKINYRHPPACGSFKDHILIIFRKIN